MFQEVGELEITNSEIEEKKTVARSSVLASLVLTVGKLIVGLFMILRSSLGSIYIRGLNRLLIWAMKHVISY
jgi:hypothetical protein